MSMEASHLDIHDWCWGGERGLTFASASTGRLSILQMGYNLSISAIILSSDPNLKIIASMSSSMARGHSWSDAACSPSTCRDGPAFSGTITPHSKEALSWRFGAEQLSCSKPASAGPKLVGVVLSRRSSRSYRADRPRSYS